MSEEAGDRCAGADANSPVVRLATEADIPAMHGVFCRAEGGLRLTHGFPWVDPPVPWFSQIVRHLLSTDPGRCYVAVANHRIVGFSGAFVRGGTWFLSALFIDPEWQGGGTGRALLEHAAREAPTRRITITDAIQPVSNAVYPRYGLIPTTPVLLFEGSCSIRGPGELEPVSPEPDHLGELDRAAYGFARGADHTFWRQQRQCTLWRRDGVPVAYSYRALTGSIGPLAAVDPASAAAALRSELGRTGRASVLIPGSSRSLVEVAVEARLPLMAPLGTLLLSRGLRPPDSLSLSNYFLY